MTEDRDPPIEEPNFIAGVTVVNIGDVRVARGLTRRAHSSCPHRAMIYDTHERRIWCRDCEHDVEGYDAFVLLVEQYHSAYQSLVDRDKRLSEAETFQVRSLAAKEIDKAWRHRSMIPACPHCSHGLYPEDFKNGVFSMLGRDYADALRRRSEK